MVTIVAPLTVPRIDPVPRAALATAGRDAPHGWATIRQHLVARYGEKPKDAMLRMLLRIGDG